MGLSTSHITRSYKARTYTVRNGTGQGFNSSPPGQNGRHIADGSFKRIFMNEKICISIRISLKVVPSGLNDNKSALVQAMAWRRAGDKPLPVPMMIQFNDVYMRYMY